MEETNKITFDKQCQRIVDNAPLNLGDDRKMRYICHELALLLSKDVEFFYEKDNLERKKEIYDNYQKIEDGQVICRNAAYIHVELARKLGLDCKMIEAQKGADTDISHWAIEYKGENDKRYIINPIPDFSRIQIGFPTKSFCSVSEYPNYDGPPFDTMSDEYLRKMDTELGYLSGGMYTDELFRKLQSEINIGLAKHVVRTSEMYQKYYLTLLELMQNSELTIEEKLERLKPIEPNLDKHKAALKECLENKKLNREVRKAMYARAVQTLSNQESNLDKEMEGSKYNGSFDIVKFKSVQREILIYKFNYMMECIPQLTNSLTGYIENKNFLDELKQYIFKKGGERERIHRHTVYKLENGKKEYYVMLSLCLDKETEEKVYCFFNQKTKECIRNIEPLDFMLEHELFPIKDSTLNDELKKNASIKQMLNYKELSNNIETVDFKKI